jgi:O-antigen ligase
VRGIARRLDYVALFLVCGAVLLTLIRSAVLGLFVVLVITVLRRPSRAANRTRASAARVQFALLVGAILIFAVPAAAGLHVVDRFLGKDDYSSNDAHRDSLNKGYGELLEHPLGNGLATAAGAGQRSAVEGVVISENQYLQVGTQLGILGLALWVGVLVATIVELGRRALRAPPGFDVGALLGPRTALLALAASGLFLQVYIDFSVAWSLWVLAGLGLGISDTWLQDESTHSPSSRSDRSTVGARA